MSMFDNPSFYISLISSVAFISSEILPFLPIKSNGIVHAIIQACANLNVKEQQVVSHKKENENKDVVITINDINDIKDKLNSIIENMKPKPIISKLDDIV